MRRSEENMLFVAAMAALFLVATLFITISYEFWRLIMDDTSF